jgi:hypothetical protein
MASGVFWVTGPRDLQVGLEPRPNKRVARGRVDLQMRGLLDPLAQRFRGGTPRRLPECLRKRRQHIWGARGGLASRAISIQQSLQATRLVKGKPVAEGLAMNPQPLGHLPAGLSWPTGQDIEQLQAWFLTAIMFTW